VSGRSSAVGWAQRLIRAGYQVVEKVCGRDKAREGDHGMQLHEGTFVLGL